MADGGIDTRTAHVSAEEALAMHASGRPGKLEIRVTKPIVTARDLSLAYSPGFNITFDSFSRFLSLS